MKIKLEYIWLDGYEPEPNLRSKIKVLDFQPEGEHPMSPMHWARNNFSKIPEWNFDGSSTRQAEGKFSDCILKPVRLYLDPIRGGFSFFVFCEVLNSDYSPHVSNYRAKIEEDDANLWFGFEQEYVLRWFNKFDNKPVGFENFNPPESQGKYYCSVGHPYSAGREISEQHLDACLACGIDITGTNAEVMLGQWEYQIFAKGEKSAADDLWMSRFLLLRIAESYKIKVDFHPKPMGAEADWNGSGMHTNFSNFRMREIGGKEYFDGICSELAKSHDTAISLYGSDNHLRLTGNHETQSIDKFSWGISDRGASIRIPISTSQTWKGYLEDRRPGSNADPYKITSYLSQVLDDLERN
jgi:glutamine synthetase